MRRDPFIELLKKSDWFFILLVLFLLYFIATFVHKEAWKKQEKRNVGEIGSTTRGDSMKSSAPTSQIQSTIDTAFKHSMTDTLPGGFFKPIITRKKPTPPIENPPQPREDSVTAADTTLLVVEKMKEEITIDTTISEERAFEILNQLLDRYPQYRGTIMRELLAGSRTHLLPADPYDLQLDRWLKNPKWLMADKYSWGRMRNASSPYDPIHGYDRDKKLGVQSPVLGLVMFLMNLILGK